MGIHVDTTTLRYFVYAATAESFAEAAKRAHVSAPAISKAIARLEQELGVKLFERTTRRVKLTPSGRAALARCQRVLPELDQLPNELSGTLGALQGPLRVGTMEVFSLELLPRAFCDLIGDHPDLVPSSFEMVPQQITARLIAGELDVGLTIGATPTEGVDLLSLGSSPGVLVCGKAHPLYARGRVTPRRLRSHPFVVPRFFGLEHLPSLDQFPEARYPRRIGATIELLQMGIELAASGRFLGYFPEISIRSHLKSGRLKALKGIVTGPFELHALFRSRVPRHPAARLLIEDIEKSIAARPKM